MNSHHWAAVFGTDHAFLDMNTYDSDDELRKQGELLASSPKPGG